MSLTPEDELGVLMDCDDEPFGLASPEDYAFQSADPARSPTGHFIRQSAEKGWVTVYESTREDDGRPWIWATITEKGLERIKEMLRQGIEPSGRI